MGRDGHAVARLFPLAAIALLSVLIRIVYGAGYLGYDAYWSLVWGGELAHLETPAMSGPLAPTPHPLSIAAGALASPLGSTAIDVLEAAAIVSFATLIWVSGLAAWRLFGVAAGVLAALIVATRPDLIAETRYASVDLAFAAFVIGALAAGARERAEDRPVAVLVLLGLAGLLRPEAWLLSVAYALYVAWRRPALGRLALAAGALAPCVAWLLFDLITTGDALHSLHGTQALAEQLDRPRSIGTAASAAPVYLRALLDSNALFWGGMAGALVALWAAFDRALLPAAVLVLSLVGFGALGVSELPLLIRYLLLPAMILCLFCAVAVAGWLGESGRLRLAWMALAAVVTVWMAVDATHLPRQRRLVDEVIVARRDLQDDLVRLADRPTVRALAHRCGRVYVPNLQLVTPLSRSFGLPPQAIVSARIEHPLHGLLVSPATESANRAFAFDPREPADFPFAVPPSFRPAAGNESWVFYESC